MDKPRTKITLSFNEIELTAIKAALFRYAKVAPGRFAQMRAKRLAEVIKSACLAFDSETYMDSDPEGYLHPHDNPSYHKPALLAREEEDNSPYQQTIAHLVRYW